MCPKQVVQGAQGRGSEKWPDTSWAPFGVSRDSVSPTRAHLVKTGSKQGMLGSLNPPPLLPHHGSYLPQWNEFSPILPNRGKSHSRLREIASNSANIFPLLPAHLVTTKDSEGGVRRQNSGAAPPSGHQGPAPQTKNQAHPFPGEQRAQLPEVR